MDINYSEIADKIFTTLVGSNFKVEAFDNQGNAELNPENASRFVSPQLTVNLDRDRQSLWVDIQEESAKNSIIDLLKGIAREHNLDFDYKVFGRAIRPKRESIMTAIESISPCKLDEVLPALAAGVAGRMAAGAAVRAGAGELGSALTGSAASSAVKSALSPKDLEDVDVDEAHDEDHNDKIYAQMYAIAQNIGDREEVAAERRRRIFHPEEFADQVRFSVNSDKAQHAIMSRYGEFIDQDEHGHLVAPRKIWSKIEQVAYDADGEGAEEIYDTEAMKSMRNESSDPSGVFHAARHLNKSFLVKAEMAQGSTKTFRVKAQSERVAREKFQKQHAQAKVLSVKEEQDVAEGSESANQKIEKKIQAKRDALGLAREQRRARGQHQQGQREIKIQAEIDRLSNELTQLKKQGMAEGYILKKTNVDKTFKPGDPDEYYTSGGADVTTKHTDYEIINNKTGQIVGVASWTTNDYFGPGALKITMKNGATRWLDIWEREKGNPQTAFNRFVKDPKTAKKYKDQGMAEGYWQDAVKKAEAEREARKGKPFEKNPASHDKQGVYKGDKDLAGNPVPKRKEQGMAEGQGEGKTQKYEMMMRNGQVKKFVAKDDADAKRIAAGHGAKSVIKMKGNVPGDKIAKKGVAEGSEQNDRTVHISKDDWPEFESWMESEGLGISEEDGIKHNDLGDVIELVYPPHDPRNNSATSYMYASEWDVRDQNMQEDAQIDEAFKDDLKKLFGIIGLAGTIGYGAWLDHLATYDTPLVHEIVRQAQAGNEGAIKDLHNISLRDGSTVEMNRLLNKYGFRSEYERKTPEPTMERSTPVPPPKVGFARHGRKAKARMPYKSVNQDKYVPAAYDEKKAKTRKDIEDYFYRKEIGETMNKQGVAEEKVLEGFGHMLGSTKTSYQPLDGVKIIVRHKSAVSEEVRGSRSRNIKEIFIQRGDERFKMRENSLQAARAMARHVHSGGEVYDDVGKAINEMATEQKALANFVRFVSRSGMVNETNQEYVDLATKRVHAIREAFRKLMGPKTYANAVENINNEVSVELTETDLDLESKFTSISCDKRVTNAVASMQAALARESAFQGAIQEAINKEDFGAIKSRLQEQDAIQFENPSARLAYQVSQLSTVAQDSRLGTYLSNISKKIGEGIELEAFETKTVKLCLERAKCQGGRKKSKMESRDAIKESKSYVEFIEKFDIF